MFPRKQDVSHKNIFPSASLGVRTLLNSSTLRFHCTPLSGNALCALPALPAGRIFSVSSRSE